MNIIVEKLTGVSLMRRACEMTRRGGGKSRMTLAEMYRCEHSPMYTQWFWVEMLGIPAFVAKELRTHGIGGTVHFITTGREDLGAPEGLGRRAPVNHGMMVNAKALVDIARRRLCYKAHATTRAIVQAIKREVARVDPDLADRLVPGCVYRQGCYELEPCGEYDCAGWSRLVQPGGVT